MKAVHEELKRVGAVLLRDKRHRVYMLPNGQRFVIARTPSCPHAVKNALAELRRCLKR